MKIVCGLGNPGREYERHRHNIGFRVVERLAERARTSFDKVKFDAELAQAGLGGEKVLLIKPQTFMNLSGRSVAGAAGFYKVAPADVLVVHDELDLPFGRLQLKAGGGAGGHNGLRSIQQLLGTDAYPRLRFGIGKPLGPNAKERVVGHVLSGFTAEEERALEDRVQVAAEAAEAWLKEGLSSAMNRFNRKG
jgi:PTH1 family peptidyl-tRNA hydrolase